MLKTFNKVRLGNSRSRSLAINFDNYKKICYDKQSYHGVSHVRIDCLDCGEHDYRRMLYDVLNAEKFDGLYSIHVNAPHIPLDGTMLDRISLKKRYIRELYVTAWTVHVPPEKLWEEFDDLHCFNLDIADGQHVPDATNKLIEGIKVKKHVLLHNHSPFYPSLDLDLFDKCNQDARIDINGYYIESFTLNENNENKKTNRNIGMDNCKHLHIVNI